MSKRKAHQQAQKAFQARIQKCSHPQCNRLCAGKWCHVHRPAPAPAGEWAISQAIREELGRIEQERGDE